MLDAMVGFDEKDSTSLNIPHENFSNDLDKPFENATISKPLIGIRIGVPKEYFSAALDDNVAISVKNGIKSLEDLGAKIKEISLPTTNFAVAAYYVIAPAEASSNLSRFDGIRFGHRSKEFQNLNELYTNSRTEGFGEEVRRRILVGTFVLSHGYYDAYYMQALKVRRLVTLDFEDAFKNCDLVVGPTSPIVAWDHDKSPSLGNNDGLEGVPSEYLADIYTVGANLGGYPAMSIPCGFSQIQNAKRPIGLQLIGPKLHEKVILKCAHMFQKSTHWHTCSPNK
jgi:aspartyl-tRNA(Asn)/glutamyl-tRNA(Gln) amidotransferase subunit A